MKLSLVRSSKHLRNCSIAHFRNHGEFKEFKAEKYEKNDIHSVCNLKKTKILQIISVRRYGTSKNEKINVVELFWNIFLLGDVDEMKRFPTEMVTSNMILGDSNVSLLLKCIENNRIEAVNYLLTDPFYRSLLEEVHKKDNELEVMLWGCLNHQSVSVEMLRLVHDLWGNDIDINKKFMGYMTKDNQAIWLNMLTANLLFSKDDPPIEKIQALLELGLDVNFQPLECHESAFHWAARRGNIPLAEILLKHGANINALTMYDAQMQQQPREEFLQLKEKGFGATPLHFAIQHSQKEFVKWLVEQDSIDLSINDCKGINPTTLSYILKEKEITDILIKKGGTIQEGFQ